MFLIYVVTISRGLQSFHADFRRENALVSRQTMRDKRLLQSELDELYIEIRDQYFFTISVFQTANVPFLFFTY